MMKAIGNIPLLDEILNEWKEVVGEDLQGYRNHCTRVLLCCFALKEDCTEDDKVKLTIASAFHDIGIWVDNTVDYIPPSLPPARAYLEKIDKPEWYEEVALMITEHHKINKYKNQNYPLVEVFRKADLVDFSKGRVRFGLPKKMLKDSQQSFPNEGFHKMLLRRAMKWLIRHPLNPAPMMKW